jgi:hypothetical protein
MIARGVPLNYVSRARGHHSTAFTAGVYATAHPESRLEDVDQFANLVLLNEPSGDAAGPVVPKVGEKRALFYLDPKPYLDAPEPPLADHPVDGAGVDPETKGDLGGKE